jgi:hypothetical protein
MGNGCLGERDSRDPEYPLGAASYLLADRYPFDPQPITTPCHKGVRPFVEGVRRRALGSEPHR